MTIKFIPQVLLIIAISINANAHAETISGRVVKVVDGDTLTILDQSNTKIKIRLTAIDSPEKAQPFGKRGKQQLSDLCYSKNASVIVVSKDRDGRTVGDVDCAGINANSAMVQSGLAWVYPKYAKGYGHLYGLEEEARNSRRGLWADDNPIAPWDWRKSKRNNRS